MPIHVTPIPSTIELATPDFSLGLANSAGTEKSAVASDSTLLVFDGSLPDELIYSQPGGTGSAVVVARRDHAHQMPAGFTASLVMAYK